MKKTLTILFTVLSCAVMAQKPIQPLGVKTNRVKVLGEFAADSAMVFPKDTIKLLSTDRAIAFKGATMYMWNGSTWVLPLASTVDSILASLSKKVDSITFNPSENVDTVIYHIGGSSYIAGYIDRQSGLISGGIVTWSGTGLSFDVTPAIYRIGGKRYTSPAGSVTLSTADPTLPRLDVIAVDTTGHIIVITGTPSVNPSIPQTDPAYQIYLTSVLVPAGATTPAGVQSEIVYDENVEWQTSTTSTGIDFNSTPAYHGSKAISGAISSSGVNLFFTNDTPVQATDYTTLKFYIKRPQQTGRRQPFNLAITFYNGSNSVSNKYKVGGTDGVTDDTSYLNISIPLSNFNFSSNTFDNIRFTYGGAGETSFLLDYIQLQKGITNDGGSAGNFVTNIYKKASTDSVFYTRNDIPVFAFTLTDTSLIKNLISDSIASKLNIGDTIVFSRKGDSYTIHESDSAYAVIRGEIVDAAGGGVISFNGRTGPVVSDTSDYNEFYYLKEFIDSVLALKQNVSDVFSGSYNDLTDKPITVTNLSLGTVTSTSQALNNSNGTGVVLPSASITTAGLLTASDKVLIGTITGKLNISDTTGKWLSLAKANTLYKGINYVPTWSEITSKPTFATVATTGSYNDLLNKPTIPDNNNQIANGMQYITSIDSANFLHKTDTTNKWVQNVYARGDSLFKLKNGVETFVQKSTAGSGGTDNSAYHTITPYPDLVTLNRPDGTKDSIVYPKTTINLHAPLRWNLADTSMNFLSDSLVSPLKYSGVDSADYDDSTLIPKGYLNDRLAAFVTGGVTQSQLDDSTAAIRNALQSGGITQETLEDSLALLREALKPIPVITKSPLIVYSKMGGDPYDSLGIKKSSRTDSGYLSKEDFIKFDDASNSSGSDTDFVKIKANNLGGSVPNYKGLLLTNETINGSPQNSPPIVWRGWTGSGSTPLYFRMFLKGSSSGTVQLETSSDSITWFSIASFGFANFSTNSVVTTGQVTVGSILTVGTESVINSDGRAIFGSRGSYPYNINPYAEVELRSTTRGLLNARVRSSQRDTITGSVQAGSITNPGGGYTAGVSGAGAVMVGGSGTGQKAQITVSGGVVTAVIPIALSGKGYKVGDILTCPSIPGGSGFQYTVTKLTGDTAQAIQLYDTSINSIVTFNKRNWQNDFIKSAASSLTLDFGVDYVFTGTTATYTLPPALPNYLGRSNMILIKNRGTGAIAVNSDTGNTIYTTSATNTITIAAGAAAALLPDGTYFNLLYNN